MAETNGKAAPIQLDDKGKLRLIYLLMMHQGNTIKVDDFDAGTGHSTEAIKSLLARLKKQFVTDAKPGDGAASVTAAAATPKKRGRAAKAEEGAEEGEKPAKKARAPRKKAVKEAEAPKADERKTEGAKKTAQKPEDVTKDAEKVANATKDAEIEKDERTDSIFGQPTKSITPTPAE